MKPWPRGMAGQLALLAEKWDNHRFSVKLVNPANKRRFRIIVVGSGLAGASAAASLGELGYEVTMLTFHDSPRRAHSIAAQGGIFGWVAPSTAFLEGLVPETTTTGA